MHAPAGVTQAQSTRNVAGPRGLQRQVVWACDLPALQVAVACLSGSQPWSRVESPGRP